MTKKAKSQIIAAIDVGSHMLGMKIVEIDQRQEVKTLEVLRKSISLGRDTFAMGKVDFETVDETCEILKGFKQLMNDYDIKIYRAVATSAVREARNKDYIVDQIRLKTGLKIDVIGNSEERYLTYKSIEDHMKNYHEVMNQGAIIVDIGSGSIQVSIYNDGKLTLSQNIKLGSLRIREVLSSIEGRTLNFPRILEEYIAASIDTLKMFQSREIFKNFIAIGGEIRSISSMCNKTTDVEKLKHISKKSFEKIYHAMMYKPTSKIMEEYGIPFDTADILLPSMMIFKKFMDITTADEIYAPMVTLTDGIISEFKEKSFTARNRYDSDEDILSSARFMAQRYRYDQKHALFVEKQCLAIFDGLKKLHGLGQRERFLLQMAAILHDIGKFIDLNEHYIHSYQIIMASNLLGVSREELAIIANISRYHSRVVPRESHENFNSLSEENRIRLAKLIAMMRVADALDRSHRQKIGDIKISLEDEDKQVIIRVDSQEEILLEEWTFETKAEFFQEVFGVTPILKIKRKMDHARL